MERARSPHSHWWRMSFGTEKATTRIYLPTMRNLHCLLHSFMMTYAQSVPLLPSSGEVKTSQKLLNMSHPLFFPPLFQSKFVKPTTLTIVIIVTNSIFLALYSLWSANVVSPTLVDVYLTLFVIPCQILGHYIFTSCNYCHLQIDFSFNSQSLWTIFHYGSVGMKHMSTLFP